MYLTLYKQPVENLRYSRLNSCFYCQLIASVFSPQGDGQFSKDGFSISRFLHSHEFRIFYLQCTPGLSFLTLVVSLTQQPIHPVTSSIIATVFLPNDQLYLGLLQSGRIVSPVDSASRLNLTSRPLRFQSVLPNSNRFCADNVFLSYHCSRRSQTRHQTAT